MADEETKPEATREQILMLTLGLHIALVEALVIKGKLNLDGSGALTHMTAKAIYMKFGAEIPIPKEVEEIMERMEKHDETLRNASLN